MSDISNEEKLSIPKIAEKLGTTHTTVQTTRTEYASGGVEQPPEGYKRWSIRLLCKISMEKGIIDHIGPTSMRKILNNGTTSKIKP